MTTKLWTESTNVLTELLNKHVTSSEQRSNIIKEWNTHKPKAERKKKDKNEPSRPKSAYLCFSSDRRESVKKENPELNAKQIMTRLGALWKELSPKAQEKYQKMALEDKARYEREMKNYVPEESSDEKPAKREKKEKKERTGPKKPLSSYMYYCQEMRPVVKTSDMKGSDLVKELGKRWGELSDEEKKPFEKMAQADKERYAREVSGSSEPEEPKVKESKKETKEPKKEVKESKKEKKEPKKEVKESKKKGSLEKTPGYQIFFNEKREELLEDDPDMSTKKMTAEINSQWLALPEDDRESYELDAQED